MSSIERVPIEYAQPLTAMPDSWQMPSVGTIINFRRSMQLGEVPTHHRALAQVAEAIPDDAVQSRDTRELVHKLLYASHGELAAGRPLVGLAAPQIGVSRRVFLANFSMDKNSKDYDPFDLTPMINPQITIAENSRTAVNPEGCYSCGPVTGRVERPQDMYVAWTDTKGKRREEVLQGFGSTVVGHENDHIDGNLFADLVVMQGEELSWVEAEQADAGEYGAIIRAGKKWKPSCSVDQWKAMKRPDDEAGPKFRLEDFSIRGYNE